MKERRTWGGKRKKWNKNKKSRGVATNTAEMQEGSFQVKIGNSTHTQVKIFKVLP